MKYIHVVLLSCMMSSAVYTMDTQAQRKYKVVKKAEWEARETAFAFVRGESPRLVSAAGQKGVVRVWDMKAMIANHSENANYSDDGELVKEDTKGYDSDLYTCNSEVTCLAADAERIVSGSRDCMLRLFDIGSEAVTQELKVSGYQLYCAELCAEGNGCIVLSSDAVVRCDFRSGETDVISDKGASASLSLGGQGLGIHEELVLYAVQGEVRLHDMRAGQERHTWEVQSPMAVGFNQDGSRAAFSTAYAGVHLKDVESGEQVALSKGRSRSAEKIYYMACVNPDHVMCINDSGWVYHWNVSAGIFDQTQFLLGKGKKAIDSQPNYIAVHKDYGYMGLYAIELEDAQEDT